MITNFFISILIGPPNLCYLTSIDKSSLKARDVADSILSDKSTLIFSSSHNTQLNLLSSS
ncbi:PsbP domain-containing protein 5, chloroplastic [Dendrobium catenatum]|uniref:PsbP domain-containing protein 5, chloroplastic n=1 Tax=Dendrobium catenatum TaxID=906689 RepID=A0A2I0VVS5_9ASPA|nr:PsbP domain-containing protein 5, chloroplastic [Dendrobium catenatum]